MSCPPSARSTTWPPRSGRGSTRRSSRWWRPGSARPGPRGCSACWSPGPGARASSTSSPGLRGGRRGRSSASQLERQRRTEDLGDARAWWQGVAPSKIADFAGEAAAADAAVMSDYSPAKRIALVAALVLLRRPRPATTPRRCSAGGWARWPSAPARNWRRSRTSIERSPSGWWPPTARCSSRSTRTERPPRGNRPPSSRPAPRWSGGRVRRSVPRYRCRHRPPREQPRPAGGPALPQGPGSDAGHGSTRWA